MVKHFKLAANWRWRLTLAEAVGHGGFFFWSSILVYLLQNKWPLQPIFHNSMTFSHAIWWIYNSFVIYVLVCNYECTVASHNMCIFFFTFSFAAKEWKRMVTKATFVGPGFTRKPPKYERFIRPSGLRFTKAHVTHPELKCTFNLEIIGVKKNPNGPMYTSLGVMTKGTIIEVIFTSVYMFMNIHAMSIIWWI